MLFACVRGCRSRICTSVGSFCLRSTAGSPLIFKAWQCDGRASVLCGSFGSVLQVCGVLAQSVGSGLFLKSAEPVPDMGLAPFFRGSAVRLLGLLCHHLLYLFHPPPNLPSYLLCHFCVSLALLPAVLIWSPVPSCLLFISGKEFSFCPESPHLTSESAFILIHGVLSDLGTISLPPLPAEGGTVSDGSWACLVSALVACEDTFLLFILFFVLITYKI